MSYCKRNCRHPYNNDYTWRKPISASGKQTVYLKVLLYLKAFGPSTKREILGTIKHMNTNFESWRGYYSKMFSCMHFDHLIEYNPSNYRWTLGEFGKKMIDIALSDKLPPIQIENIDDDYKTLAEMHVDEPRKPLIIGAPKDDNLRRFIHKDNIKATVFPIPLYPTKSTTDEIGLDIDDFIMDIEEFISKLQLYKLQLKKLKEIKR